MPSRRVLLRAAGASGLAALAGCSGGGRSDPESTSETTSDPSTAAEYQETTIMSATTTASETTPASEPTSATETADGTETTDVTGTSNAAETATADEARETAEETTSTTEDEPDSRSYPSNGSGNPSSGDSSPDDSETTESTTTTTATETTSDSDPTTEPTTTETTPATTERPPAATTTTETTPGTTTTQPPTTTTEQPTTTTATTTTETTTAEEPPSGGSWSTGPDLPAPQSNAGGGVIDGSVYCFGGIESGENLPAVARTYRFDPAGEGDGTWTRLDDVPRALWAPCGVAAEGKLYSFGGAPTDAPYGTGESPSDEIFVYEPAAGWRDLTAETGVRCPYPNWAMGGVYDPDDGLIYLVGGGTDVTDRESTSDHGVSTDDPGTYDESRIWTFDPATEEVANPDLARLPTARRWPAVALVEVGGETCLHAICGLFGVTGPTDENLRYRVSTDEWESMTPAPRSGAYATTGNPVIDGTIYLTHGFFWEDSPSVDSYAAACHAYDPAADSFQTDLSHPEHLRGGAVDAVVDDALYVVGGHVKRYDQNGYHDCTAATEAFDPTA